MVKTSKREAKRLAKLYCGQLLIAQDWPMWAENCGIDIHDDDAFNAFMDEMKRIGYNLREQAVKAYKGNNDLST
jgi:hypothetical protein